MKPAETENMKARRIKRYTDDAFDFLRMSAGLMKSFGLDSEFYFREPRTCQEMEALFYRRMCSSLYKLAINEQFG